MASKTHEITLEQLCQESVVAGIGEDADVTVRNSPDGSMAQVDFIKNPFVMLDHLTHMLSPAHALDTLPRSLTALVRQVLRVDLCIVMLTDGDNSFLTMQATSPDLNDYEIRFTPPALERVPWKKLRSFNAEGQLAALTVHEQEQLNPLKQVQYETLLAVPLSVGNDDLGLLICYANKNCDYGMEEQALLRTIINQAALTIQNRRFAHAPAFHSSVKSFFDDLLSLKPGQEESLRGRANLLGCDLTQPSIMLMIEMVPLISPGDTEGHKHHQQVASQALQTQQPDSSEQPCSGGTEQTVYMHAMRLMRHRLQERCPGSLVDDRENVLFCIMPLNSYEGLRTGLGDLMHQIEMEQQVRVCAGIGNPHVDIHDFKKGFAEAGAALRIGQHFKHEAGFTHFNDLGVYRYIYEFACSNTLDDVYLEKIAAIACYDRQRKGSELLDTLEAFLESGGNIKDAAKRLHVHRNTIILRLKHIEELCNVRLDQPEQRLRLQVALMIHTLRAHQASFSLRSDKTMST
jgi:sugar diacid utilization regulator